MKKIITLILIVIAFASAKDIDSTSLFHDFMNGMGTCTFISNEYSEENKDTMVFFVCENGDAAFLFKTKTTCMSINGIDNAKKFLADDVYEDLKAEKVNKLDLCFNGRRKKDNIRIEGTDDFGVGNFAAYATEKITIHDLYKAFKLTTMK